MTPTGHDARGPLAARLARRLRLARLAIVWERLWPALWPAPLVLGLFLLLALFDVLPLLGPWGHAAVLALLGLALLASLWRAVRAFRLPQAADAERRIERASGFSHRPLATLADRPVGGDGAAALWAAHQRRAAAAIRRLRVGPPRSDLPRRDPWALRAAVLAGIFVAVLVAGDRAEDRVARALTPALARMPAAPSTVDLWIEPPAYTGLAPIYVRADRPELTVPAGSGVVARVGGGDGTPLLAIDEATTPFLTAGEAIYELRTAIDRGRSLRVLQDGAPLAQWQMTVVPDAPPQIAFTRPPTATHRYALRIDHAAQDDYGVRALAAELRPADSGAQEPALQLPIPIAAVGGKRVEGSSYHDLTAHPWAGREVELRLVGTDGAGQTGASETVRVTLPERAFTHPVARAIIEARKQLAEGGDARLRVARRLDAIAQMDDFFDHDTVVSLGLLAAKWRLRYDERPEGLEAARELLWDTALRLEDGNLTVAERELRQAQQELMDALSRDAPQAEIDRLLNKLWAAIEKYLQSMMAQSEEQPLTPQDMENMQTLQSQDLREMLQRMRDMAQSGAKDAAMQMLSQLQNMLENLRQARMMGQQGQQAQQMMRMMRQLQDLANQQRGLMDETFRNAQQGRQGMPPPGMQMPGQMRPGGQPRPGQQPGQGQPMQVPDLAQQQEALRRMLGELMRQMGEQGQIPNALGRAERAMRDAMGRLEEGQPGDAVPSQSEALDQLQQAGRQMSRELSRQMGLGQGQQEQGDSDPGSDPLGRPPGGLGMDTRDVAIPTESDVQRARRIRDELHRRSGERGRPQFERDYIERLLDRF